MIAILKPMATPQQTDALKDYFAAKGLECVFVAGKQQNLLTVLGDTHLVDAEQLEAFPAVDRVLRISTPYPLSSRKLQPKDTVVSVSDIVRIGGGHFCLIAGPCSVEREAQLVAVAQAVKANGAAVLRGGAFKPRTSPYDFQGLQGEGLRMLQAAKKQTGLPIISEIVSADDLPLYEDVDILQVGARNMQNYALLKRLSELKKPILLKRGLSATLKELLLSAEYLLRGGNENVILCERGIRTFEPYTRNTLDLSAVPALKQLTHLPVVVDPSHATGRAGLVPAMALAAAAAGADGVMVEVHSAPAQALCDGAQALTPAEFTALSEKLTKLREVLFD